MTSIFLKPQRPPTAWEPYPSTLPQPPQRAVSAAVLESQNHSPSPGEVKAADLPRRPLAAESTSSAASSPRARDRFTKANRGSPPLARQAGELQHDKAEAEPNTEPGRCCHCPIYTEQLREPWELSPRRWLE